MPLANGWYAWADLQRILLWPEDDLQPGYDMWNKHVALGRWRVFYDQTKAEYVYQIDFQGWKKF